MDLQQEFCKQYQISYRHITDSQLISILSLLILHFKKITFEDTENLNCNYSMMSYIESKISRGDEDYPFCGTGWNLKDVILTQCLDTEAIFNDQFYEEVRYLLMTKWERILKFLRIIK